MLDPATRCAICGSAWLVPSTQATEEVTAPRASEEFAADLEWIEPTEAISDPLAAIEPAERAPDAVAAIEETGATPDASLATAQAANTERDLLRKLAEALEPPTPCLPPDPPIPVAELASSALDIVPEPLSVTNTDALDIAPEPLSEASPALDVVPQHAAEIVAAAPAIMPPIAQTPPLARVNPVTGNARPPLKTLRRRDFASFAARRQRRAASWQPFRLPRPGLPAAIVALLAAASVLIAGRSEIVRHAPQTASLYAAIGLPVNLRALVFDNVKTARESHDGVNVLVVEGNIVSNAAKAVEVPRLRFAIRDPGGLEIYRWTALPDRPMLAPGEQMAFRSRLAAPPAESSDVMVRFLGGNDAVAGLE